MGERVETTTPSSGRASLIGACADQLQVTPASSIPVACRAPGRRAASAALQVVPEAAGAVRGSSTVPTARARLPIKKGDTGQQGAVVVTTRPTAATKEAGVGRLGPVRPPGGHVRVLPTGGSRSAAQTTGVVLEPVPAA